MSKEQMVDRLFALALGGKLDNRTIEVKFMGDWYRAYNFHIDHGLLCDQAYRVGNNWREAWTGTYVHNFGEEFLRELYEQVNRLVLVDHNMF